MLRFSCFRLTGAQCLGLTVMLVRSGLLGVRVLSGLKLENPARPKKSS